jgi:membrane-associated protease RseP (regulator of RpoE activity)
MTLGSSLILYFMTTVILGTLPDTHQVILHPLGFAGWIGLLVTSMNLIPVGQLDGGHIAYAVFGRRTKHISTAVLICLLGLGIWASHMWLMWALILFALLGIRHPAPLDHDAPLDGRRRMLGLGMLVIFVLTFVPVPFGDL